MSMELLGDWVGRGRKLRESFEAAEPFPHVVIDGFLARDFANALAEEFPAPADMPKSRDYVFGEKRELSSIEARGPQSRAYHDLLLSPGFAEVLNELTGRELFVDPAHHGGGFHQGGDGSFLETHVDFNVHPLHGDWLRVLNILLYLSKDWQSEYDGALLVRTDPRAEPARIMPAFNRAVIMLTAHNTYHGYRRMSLPPGVTRKLIASYAYEQIDEGSVRPRTTGWAPETGRIKGLLARHYDPLVRAKNRVFGSGTARNR